jgi:hypothetical protein
MFIKEITRFFLLPIYKPRQGIDSLVRNKRKIGYAVLIFLFLGIIYTISVQLAYMKGFGANVEPFIKIPANEYYFWQRFYQIPFFFITSILFAGIVRLISIPFHGVGTYEDHFCLFTVAQTLPMFVTMWLPETIYFAIFNSATILPTWADVLRQVIGIIWPLMLMVLGISLIEKIKWTASLLITLIAAIPVTALMVIFIR